MNPRIFIGGLTKRFTEADVDTLFGYFGTIMERNVEQIRKGSIGWVQFDTRQQAEVAIYTMQSYRYVSDFLGEGGRLGYEAGNQASKTYIEL